MKSTTNQNKTLAKQNKTKRKNMKNKTNKKLCKKSLLQNDFFKYEIIQNILKQNKSFAKQSTTFVKQNF